MFDIAILDVAIGLMVTFFVFSLTVSGIYELIAKTLKLRAKTLWDGVARLVDDPPGAAEPKWKAYLAMVHGSRRGDRRPAKGVGSTNLVGQLYEHTLIGAIEPAKQATATRIDNIRSNDFARALIDVVTPGSETGLTLTKVRMAVDDLAAKNSPLAAPFRLLVNELKQTEQAVDEFKDKVAGWFDSQMTTLSLAYRRRVKWWLFFIACGVTIALNIDAVLITRTLFQDDALRAAAVAQAESIVDACADEPDPAACMKTSADEAKRALQLPVGWGGGFKLQPDQDAWRFLGWPLAALALAQGAPFWFDLLKRAVGYRRALAKSGKDDDDD